MEKSDFPTAITIEDLKDAQARIRPYVMRTPLIASEALSELCNAPILLKLENLQPTGSFKVRGATNRLLQLTPNEKQRGVITVSSGNHGKAVARMAGKLGIPATIFLSEQTPQCKVEALRHSGAQVVVTGSCYDEAEKAAADYEEEHNLIHIPSFDDPHIIAGQGTMGLEILEDVPETRNLIYPLSGGGMAAGLGIAARNHTTPVDTWGVSMDRAPVMVRSLEAGHILHLPEEPSLADGLKGGLGIVNRYTFRLCQQLVDHSALVSEEQIGQAVAFLYTEHHLVVEGSGAVGVAALLARRILPKDPAVVVISGANIDLSVFTELVKRYSGLF
jgi:threonine dehydratase